MPNKRIFLGCACAVIVAHSVNAQARGTSTTAASADSNTGVRTQSRSESRTTVLYDSAALRIEQHSATTRVLRGVQGPLVWSQGLLFTTGNLKHVLAPSPRALAEARIFEQANRRGRIASAIGFGAFAASVIMSITKTNSAAAVLLGVGGTGLMFYGDQAKNAASTALSRAVLLHNSDLP